jgi:hypothetical protein
MGKRELLLIALFAAVGVVVYQVTAPPPAPGSQGFSIARMMQSLRRGVQGNRASAQVEKTHIELIDQDVQELRFVLGGIDLTVTGEDRPDAEIQMRVTSNGFDEAEAKRLADVTALSVTRTGSQLRIGITYPHAGIQRAKLMLRVPQRLRMRLEPANGRLDVSNLSGVEIMSMRGDTSIKSIHGPVTMDYRGGALAIDGAASVKLTTRGDAKVQHVTGTLVARTLGGDLTLLDITGPADIETRNTDLRLEQIDALKGPLRVDATNGSLKILGLRTEARIDGRDTDLDIACDAPAPVTIYSTAQDIHITPPPGSYTLDAVATDGHISISDGTLKPTASETEQRAAGPIRGGGPTLTLRATRADINVRSRTP